MNRAKLLMLSALLMACAGFLVLSQSVHSSPENRLARGAELGLVIR